MIIPFLFIICFFKITNSIELYINGDAESMLSIKAKCLIKDNGIESKIENYWKINEEVGLIKYKQVPYFISTNFADKCGFIPSKIINVIQKVEKTIDLTQTPGRSSSFTSKDTQNERRQSSKSQRRNSSSFTFRSFSSLFTKCLPSSQQLDGPIHARVDCSRIEQKVLKIGSVEIQRNINGNHKCAALSVVDLHGDEEIVAKGAVFMQDGSLFYNLETYKSVRNNEEYEGGPSRRVLIPLSPMPSSTDDFSSDSFHSENSVQSATSSQSGSGNNSFRNESNLSDKSVQNLKLGCDSVSRPKRKDLLFKFGPAEAIKCINKICSDLHIDAGIEEVQIFENGKEMEKEMALIVEKTCNKIEANDETECEDAKYRLFFGSKYGLAKQKLEMVWKLNEMEAIFVQNQKYYLFNKNSITMCEMPVEKENTNRKIPQTTQPKRGWKVKKMKTLKTKQQRKNNFSVFKYLKKVKWLFRLITCKSSLKNTAEKEEWEDLENQEKSATKTDAQNEMEETDFTSTEVVENATKFKEVPLILEAQDLANSDNQYYNLQQESVKKSIKCDAKKKLLKIGRTTIKMVGKDPRQQKCLALSEAKFWLEKPKNSPSKFVEGPVFVLGNILYFILRPVGTKSGANDIMQKVRLDEPDLNCFQQKVCSPEKMLEIVKIKSESIKTIYV